MGILLRKMSFSMALSMTFGVSNTRRLKFFLEYFSKRLSYFE